MNLFKKIQGPEKPRLRVVILSSPPWGVLEDEHDRALDTTEIKVIACFAINCTRTTVSSNMICKHSAHFRV